MAKKSQKRPLRYDKDQTGCISGLISIFDFRHGRSTRKLLPDRRKGSRQAFVVGSSRTKLMVPDSNGKCEDSEDGKEIGMASIDSVKTSVKRLMEEEMVNEQGPNKHLSDSEEHGYHTRKNRQYRKKVSKKSNDVNLYDLDAIKDMGSEKSFDQVDSKKGSDKIDFEIIMHLLHDHFDIPSDQASAVDQGKLSAAIKIFIDQSSSNIKHSRDDGQVQQSREFMDALNRLSHEKDSLLKLLQDPNSRLVKQIKDLEGAHLEKNIHSKSLSRSGFLEEKLIRSKTDELVNHKQHRNFFRRRSKSQESFPSIGSEKCQSPNKIVILKPGPATLQQKNAEVHVNNSVQSHNPEGDKIQGERSQFSFTEFKRKLKHAIRKERQGITADGITPHRTSLDHRKRHDFEKGIGGENFGWHSPNRNHFYTEKFAKPSLNLKREDKISKRNDTDPYTAKEISGSTKPGASNIYLEAKKHLLEMLSSGDNDAELISQQLPRSLGRILSFSEYNSSANSSPRKGTEDCSVTAERMLSPCDGIEIVNKNKDQVLEENLEDSSSTLKYSLEIRSTTTNVGLDEKVESLEASRSLSCVHNHANLDDEALSSGGGALVSEGATGIEETTKTNHEGYEISNAAYESCNSYSLGDGQNGDAGEEYHEDGLKQSLEMESFGECQTLSSPSTSPSCSSVAIKLEDFEGAVDRTERPSPVSVLEPLFVEDDISPARTISRPVELEIQPRQIQFEEGKCSSVQEICMQTVLEDEESAFEYVEAVLLGSGLIWDEYLLKWISSSSILDSTLYDEVELFSSRSRHEQKLLFDCTNEVLEEVCDRYFGCFPLMSNKQNIRPVPIRMDLIREIWQGVECHLLQCPLPQSLDQLLKKDMAKSRTWMDVRSDIQRIGMELEGAILDKLVEDIVSSFIHDALENDSLSSLADLNEVQNIDL